MSDFYYRRNVRLWFSYVLVANFNLVVCLQECVQAVLEGLHRAPRLLPPAPEQQHAQALLGEDPAERLQLQIRVSTTRVVLGVIAEQEWRRMLL